MKKILNLRLLKRDTRRGWRVDDTEKEERSYRPTVDEWSRNSSQKTQLYLYEGWNFNSGNYLFTTDTK